MFCYLCKMLLPEDNSVCDNKICVYLNKKIKEKGLLQFYLEVYWMYEAKEDFLLK